MSIRPVLLLLLLFPACVVAPRAAGVAVPGLLADVRPDVRVVALAVQPAADGWQVAGQLVLPYPVRPGETLARLEGLDAQGRTLVATDLRLDVAPSRPRARSRAALLAVLPAVEGLHDLRLSVPLRP